MPDAATRLISLIMLLQRRPSQKAAVAVNSGTSQVGEMWGQLCRDAAPGALAKLDNVLPD